MYDNGFGDAFDQIFGGMFGERPEDMELELNRLWNEWKVDDYYTRIYQYKAKGYKILRNSDGNHKVSLR